MAKKAKLDLLEVNIDVQENRTSPDERDRERGVEDLPIEALPSVNLILRIKLWIQTNLIRSILIVVLLIGLIAAALLWYAQGREEKSVVPAPDLPLSKADTPVEQIILLEGFAVDQRNAQGYIKIAFCDIALELESPGLAKDLGERMDVRNLIYTVLKRMPADTELSLEKRNQLKLEIKSNLNNLLGENTVRHVYITKYELN